MLKTSVLIQCKNPCKLVKFRMEIPITIFTKHIKLHKHPKKENYITGYTPSECKQDKNCF